MGLKKQKKNAVCVFKTLFEIVNGIGPTGLYGLIVGFSNGSSYLGLGDVTILSMVVVTRKEKG